LVIFVLAGLVVATLAAFAGQQPVQSPPPSPSSTDSTATTPGVHAQGDASERQAGKQNLDAANAARKKQAAADSERLLKLAADLKAEVDKTNQDTLSLTVIRKSSELESLARAVREKAKLTPAANSGGGS
jgi:hypothetical protein